MSELSSPPITLAVLDYIHTKVWSYNDCCKKCKKYVLLRLIGTFSAGDTVSLPILFFSCIFQFPPSLYSSTYPILLVEPVQCHIWELYWKSGFLLFSECSRGPTFWQIPFFAEMYLLEDKLSKKSDFFCVCFPLIRVCHVQRAL
jgi:hypothetical protein